MPANVVCIRVDRGKLSAVAGHHSFFRAVRSWSLRLSALMDSDLACVNGKSARQSRCYADTFKRSTISGAIYHLPFGVYVRHCLKYTLLIDCVLTLTYLLYNVSMQTTETELNGDIWSSSLAAGGRLSSAGSLDTPNMRCLPSPPAQSSQCMLTVSLLICLHHMLSSCSMMSKETREPAIANRLLVTRSI